MLCFQFYKFTKLFENGITRMLFLSTKYFHIQ
jgi:hypothetical protein